ncbi:spore gernimation protein GerPD [Paenibacillus sp. sptzw28]|nr:spore gernimation protein GerPD [Paenibacillus sp. sptzw28]
MEYTVINCELSVVNIKMSFVSTASTFIVGDVKTVSLSNVFEGPPEKLIIGVTIPVLPPIIPTT